MLSFGRLCGRALRPSRSVPILFGAFIAAGCGPTAPQTLGPILECPAPLSVVSLSGGATPAIYEAPQVIAGEPPLRTTCTPGSGAVFPLGSSVVNCGTTDAAGRTDSCTFTVTVAVPPRISATSFLAFGNSITEGKTPSGELVKSYAENLRALLSARYAAQTIVVVNAGCGGETTTAGGVCGGGVVRLPAVLDTVRPEVVLIEEGVNDLNGDNSSAIPAMIGALRTMIRAATVRSVRVFLGTLLPQREGGSRASAVHVIPDANEQIRLLAASEHIVLVDLYVGFGGGPDPFIDVDGLHPTEPGYQKIAQLYFDAVRASLEVPSGPGSAMELVRALPPQNAPFNRRH
jgi:lysophospholipase L1-like esterase